MPFGNLPRLPRLRSILSRRLSRLNRGFQTKSGNRNQLHHRCLPEYSPPSTWWGTQQPERRQKRGKKRRNQQPKAGLQERALRAPDPARDEVCDIARQPSNWSSGPTEALAVRPGNKPLDTEDRIGSSGWLERILWSFDELL